MKNDIKNIKDIKDIKAFLFDMDGVTVDTEPQYDIFWKEIQEKYAPQIEDLHEKVKGVTLASTFVDYFFDYTKEKQKEIEQKIYDFELNDLEYFEIPGVLEFIKSAKKESIKVALVTNSEKEKVLVVLEQMKITDLFDVVVTFNDVSEGKPNPECYLQAAEKLGVKPEECIVFEDSFVGIQAGKSAGANVIGLSTTNSAEDLKGLVYKIIPNFIGIKVEDII